MQTPLEKAHEIMNEKPKPIFLTVQEVAEQLRVSYMTIYRLIEEKKLPATRVSKRALRIEKADLDKFLEGQSTL